MEKAEAYQNHLANINNDFENQNSKYKDDDVNIQGCGVMPVEAAAAAVCGSPVRGRRL